MVTYGGFARTAPAPDWPFNEEDDEAGWGHQIIDGWGSIEWTRAFALDWGAERSVNDPEFVRWLSKHMRFSATPTAALAFSRAWDETDVREVLPSVVAPTLLLHRRNQGEREELERTASLIPLARIEELPPDEWTPYLGDPDPMVAAIERFLGGIKQEEASIDRALATVVFTDMVGSTQAAATKGDRTWKELVERHHAIVRALLMRYHGTEIDTAGDGFFATFDGPARGIRCAQAIIEAVRPLGIEVRTGIHTGEVETIAGKPGGMGVIIGARVGALAGPSEVLTSQTVKDLVAGSGLTFEDAGERELKGVPDRWDLYRVVE